MLSCGESESKFRTTEEQERSSYSSRTRQSDPRLLKSRVFSLDRRFLLFRLLAVFALRIVESRAFAARRERIQYKSFCVRSLCTSAFLCGLCLVQGLEVEPLPLLVGISPCFASITSLGTDPCLYRSLCFSCVVPAFLVVVFC
jgi:hypothetical protein